MVDFLITAIAYVSVGVIIIAFVHEGIELFKEVWKNKNE